MKYKCNYCEKVFDESELITEERKEPREFWGSTVYEEFTSLVCPYCGRETVEEYYGYTDDDWADEEEEEEDFAAFEADEDLL